MTLLTNRTLLSLVLVILLVTAETIHGRLSHARQVLVARRAPDFRARVRVTQNKFGLVVTKAAYRVLPVTLTVTFPAVHTQGRIVLVVFLVTRKTIPRGFLEHCTPMALLAFNFGVLAQQGETAQIMVKFLRRLLPVPFTVATRTVLAQRPLVFVVLGVAGIALLAQFDAVEIAGVAGHTRRRGMLATQSVLGVGVVIELAGLPQVCAVAGFALFTEQAFVTLGTIVVLLVTANAGARRFFVTRRLVTC